MSTARPFKVPEQPREEIERQRDLLQVRNAELVLALKRVQEWLARGAQHNAEHAAIIEAVEEAME